MVNDPLTSAVALARRSPYNSPVRGEAMAKPLVMRQDSMRQENDAHALIASAVRTLEAEAGGIACGIKPTGAPDLALVATTDRRPVPAAAVFTTNRVQAAPVQVSREHLADGRAAAVVLNSGNANAATGERGRRGLRSSAAGSAG